jgi:hypothetical protein
MKNPLIWHYKDGNRQYYTVIATIIGSVGKSEEFDTDYFETVWRCNIIRDDSRHFTSLEEASKRVYGCDAELFSADLNTQYDEPIQLQDILIEYSNATSALCIGMAKYGNVKI